MNVAVLVVALLTLAAASSASAQDTSFRPRRPIVAAGVSLVGGVGIGDMNAELRRNMMGTPEPFALFRARSRVERAPEFDLRVAYPLTRAFALEGRAGISSPRLGVTISADAEAGEDAFLSEQLSQYLVDVSAVYQIPRRRTGARIRPYLAAGGGYLRQLHEDRVLVETGRTMHVAGGVNYWWRAPAPRRRPMGARAEARYVRRTGGVEFEDRSRGYPAVSVMGFVGF